MVVNGNSSIDPTKGEYLLLVDYGAEGFTIVNQFHELQEALLGCMQNHTGSPITLVRLVTIDVAETQQAMIGQVGE